MIRPKLVLASPIVGDTPAGSLRCSLVNGKPQPNHQRYIRALQRLTPEQRLLRAFELSAVTRELFIHGLRNRFPDLPEDEFRKLLLERLALCHNRNY